MNNVQRLFFGLAMLCVFGPIFMPTSRIRRPVQRRIFWTCACLATIFGFFVFYPNSSNGLWVGGMFLGMMIFIAYAYTPYIKIRGKIYAVSISLQQPDPVERPRENASHSGSSDTVSGDVSNYQADPHPDSYGGTLTATTLWWMMVGIAVIAAGNTYFLLVGRGEAGPTAASAGLLLFTTIAAGLGDASWGYRIARGQYLQFSIASLITAGSFTAIYLIAYYTGRLWPLRRQRSMEYRAHPRHHGK